MTFNALVLAGSRGGLDPVAAYAGVGDKALAELHGATMLARVTTALREAGAARILVAASSTEVADHALALGAEMLPAEAGPSLSALRGLECLGPPLLVTTADHGLLRPEWIEQFLSSTPADADVSALLARRETIESAVPETRRTYLRFADGAWSGCNMFYLATPRARRAIEFWCRVEADRKRPWRIVRRLGPATLLRYATGRLTLAGALDRLGDLTGATLRSVDSPFGLAAVDVDKPADLDLARRLLSDGDAVTGARLPAGAPSEPAMHGHGD